MCFASIVIWLQAALRASGTELLVVRENVIKILNAACLVYLKFARENYKFPLSLCLYTRLIEGFFLLLTSSVSWLSTLTLVLPCLKTDSHQRLILSVRLGAFQVFFSDQRFSALKKNSQPEFESIHQLGNILKGVYCTISIAVIFKERRYLCYCLETEVSEQGFIHVKESSHQNHLAVKAEGCVWRYVALNSAVSTLAGLTSQSFLHLRLSDCHLDAENSKHSVLCSWDERESKCKLLLFFSFPFILVS